jgi:hypothetical protein
MAMSTPSTAALTRGARKLRQLGADAVSIPSTQELYERKCADLTDAKAKLDAIIARQINGEKTVNGQRGNVAPIVAEKNAAEATVARLQHEAGLIKQQIIDARPKPPLDPRRQMLADAFDAVARFDPYSKCARGTPEQIAAAQADLDKLVNEYRTTQPTGNAREAWTVKKNAARTRLEALKGPPYSQHRPWASNEQLKAARAKEGLKP